MVSRGEFTDEIILFLISKVKFVSLSEIVYSLIHCPIQFVIFCKKKVLNYLYGETIIVQGIGHFD